MAGKIEGGCHCGAVRYALSAPPVASMVCHCRTCRRVSGAPVVAWITVKPEAFKFTLGQPKRYKSSAKVERRFCGQCGAQLAYTCVDDMPAVHDIDEYPYSCTRLT